jgi:cyclopropane fatty-acyl-phospholipid synthase-like methyltransferase
MNIIIGSNGFLGSYLSSKIDNPININSQKYKHFIENFDKNATIYICANFQNIYKIIKDLIPLASVNNTFILFSSAVIYDGINKDSYSESDYNKLESYEYYVNEVIMNEHIFSKLKGNKIIIRLGTLYGSSPNLNASRGIHRMIYFPLINNYIEIYDGNIKKSLTSLDDLWNSLRFILNKKEEFNVYNVSSFDITINELGEFISKKFNLPIKYVENNKKNYSFYLDTTKLRSLGWEPKSNLDNLVTTINNNFKNIKEIKYDDTIIYYTCKLCRVCQSDDLFPILDLNNQPPPNRLNDKLWELINCPLILNGCNHCYHLQLSGVINPIIMYKNYTYLSGTASTMKKYFSHFVKNIVQPKKTVLDIACNDGALLDCFKENNFITYGIDPAENIVSKLNNHNIYCGFFNYNAVKYFNQKFDVVTAFNVFAHVDDIYDFLVNVYSTTHDDSDIYIQTSQCNMIQNNEFDTIYHEHLSFFNVYSMKFALEKCNFYLHDLHIVDVHGSSYLFHLKHKKENCKESQNVIQRLNYETSCGLFKRETYINYANNIYKWKDDLINLLKNQKNIIGVGASAKGITILNFIKDSIHIDYIIDENPLKINKKINSVNVNIVDFNYIKTIENDITFILFAWNFKDELIKKIKNIRNNNDTFINLFPLNSSKT